MKTAIIYLGILLGLLIIVSVNLLALYLFYLEVDGTLGEIVYCLPFAYVGALKIIGAIYDNKERNNDEALYHPVS